MATNSFYIPGQELSQQIKNIVSSVRKQLLWFLAISVILHFLPVVSNFEISQQIEEKKRPPTSVKFIQRAPKLQKTMELQKTPKIVERNIQRKSTPQRMSTMPRTMTTASSHGGTAHSSLGRPGEYVDRTFNPNQQQFYGPNITTDVVNTRAGSRTTSGLKDELIDYSNFKDRFAGWVEQGKNKKDISGYLEFYQLQYRGSKVGADGSPGWNAVPLALQAVVEYSSAKTKLDITLKGSIRLDSKELMQVPLLYMMGYEAEPIYTQQEVRNLEKYLRSGGFLWIDDGLAARYASFNKKSRQMIEDALGYDAEFERIPNGHWLYHCWEDFAGPPPGEDDVRISTSASVPVLERYKYLEGVFLNGRLAVLLSSKGYCRAWGDWQRRGSNTLDNTRQLQFAINAIVFACTQKGGIIDQNKQKVAQN